MLRISQCSGAPAPFKLQSPALPRLPPRPSRLQQGGNAGPSAAGFNRRRVLIREAVSTDSQETAKQQAAEMNGNGRPSPQAMAERNGTGSSASNTIIDVTAASSTNGTGPSTSAGPSSTVSNNGTGPSAATASRSVSQPTPSSSTSTTTSEPSTSGRPSAPAPAPSSTSMAASQPQPSTSQSGSAQSQADMSERKASDRRLNKSAAGTPYQTAGGRWSNIKSYSVLRRTLEIWTFAIQFAIRYMLINQKWTYRNNPEGMTPEAVSKRRTEVAVFLREGLVRLGPTFIKIGQQFSTRVDVLPQEFVKELEQLQDNVPAFDTKTAREIIEYSLDGRPIDEVYTRFEEQPLAAASLGQVHRASIGDQDVVVKVQRPGLRELFDIDLKNIRQLAIWLQKFDPKTDGAARDWVAIYDESARILYQEIDYTLEGRNADKFRENFRNTDWVRVPRVYWEYSSPEVLVLEYMPGVKVNNADAIDNLGLDRGRLARLSVESYLQQILRYGFYHADPHPGNVAVDNQGNLVYYDFGMMGTLAPNVREGLGDLFYGVFNRDSDKCIQALITMGVYVPTGDKTAVKRTADYFLRSFQDRLDLQKAERKAKGAKYNEDFKPQRNKDEMQAKRKEVFTSVGEDLLLAANDQPFRFPATFTFVVRSFTVLDGIGKSLDPRFDISEIAAPYARDLLLEGGAPQVTKLQRQFAKGLLNQNRAVANLFKNPNKIEDIAATMQSLERGDLKLRVRALETERALTRVEAWQRVVCAALLASCFVNVGTVLSVSAMSTGASASFVAAAFCGLQMLRSYVQVLQLERKEQQLAGAV